MRQLKHSVFSLCSILITTRLIRRNYGSDLQTKRGLQLGLILSGGHGRSILYR